MITPSKTRKFEYQHFDMQIATSLHLEQLNKLGQEGWALVHMYPRQVGERSMLALCVREVRG